MKWITQAFKQQSNPDERKPVKPVVYHETFDNLARANDQKTILKSLLRFCICRWCSVYWLKEFKK